MSEYTPITGELRDAMRQWGWVESDGSITFATSPTPPSIDAEQSLAISGSDFTQLCDAIDSIHAQLERENAALKSSVAHAYASGYEYAEMDRDGWVKLPVDADGEYIHIGDRMENNERVSRIVLTDDDWQPSVYLEKIPNVLHEYFCNEISHYHPDTWERIIEDARTCTGSAGNYTSVPSMRWTNEVDALVARCKALCERTKEDE